MLKAYICLSASIILLCLQNTVPDCYWSPLHTKESWHTEGSSDYRSLTRPILGDIEQLHVADQIDNSASHN